VASQEGHSETLKVLIEAHADVNQANKVTCLLSLTISIAIVLG
jgi:hypothetical protein